MMKRFIITQLIILFSFLSFAQNFSGKVVDNSGKPLEAVSVIVTDAGNKTLAFGYTKSDGSFAVNAKEGATLINFSIIGFEKASIATKDFKDGQTVTLNSKSFVLKEVKVRPDKITQSEDTLNYSVSQFQQGQDRSIADVIKNMPGMEISQSGQISFEGKPINKFYIEGMDLMGNKYAQASENLQAKKVQTVQVVQNHQPIKSLRGVQFSDQAAINLVLKEDAKNTWAGTADIGVGVGKELLYDGRLMAMMFSKKHQNLSMYKANNAGKDIAHEIADLASLLKNRQEMNGLLSNITVNAPNLDDLRTNFNTSHTVATNELIRTKYGNDFRIQADWLWNRQHGELYRETEYTDLNGILLSEETSVSAINNRFKTDLTYKINKDKVYLNNQIHGYIDFDRSYGTTVLNGKATRQNVQPRKRYICEDFETLKTLRNGNVLNFSSQTTYSYLPGQLLTILGSTEHLNLSGFESQNTLSFRQRIKAMTIKYETGINVKSQLMEANYQDVNVSESYNQQNIYITSSVNYEHNSLKMNASMKVDLLNASSLDNLRFTLQPRINIKYALSGTTSLQTSYIYSETANSLTSLYNTPIFTSYRTQTYYSGKFENTGLHHTNISFNYKQPVRGNFMTLEGSWIQRINNMLFQSQYENPVYLRTPTDHRYNADTYTLRAHLSKSLYWAKTSLSLNVMHNWNGYSLLIADNITDWQLQNTNIQFRVTMTPAKILSYELRSELNTSRQFAKTKEHTDGDRLTDFRHSIDLYLFPTEKCEVGLKNEIHHSSDHSVSSSHFTDAYVSYKQKRYELRLTANNLLGKEKFERRTIGKTTNLYNIYHLRSREILLSISIDL